MLLRGVYFSSIFTEIEQAKVEDSLTEKNSFNLCIDLDLPVFYGGVKVSTTELLIDWFLFLNYESYQVLITLGES